MLDQTLLTLGAVKLGALILGRGETCVDLIDERAVALVLVRGSARVNGVTMEVWRPIAVAKNCRVEALEPSVIARVAITSSENTAHGNSR